MYSKRIDFPKFNNDLAKYIQTHRIKLIDTPILDIMIENPDIQRLMVIWLQNNNEQQLNHLLTKTLETLTRMSDETQETALNELFKHAHLLSNMIPEPSDLHKVLESMGEDTGVHWDGWADLNMPLYEFSDEDIKKLDHHSFFIVGGLFTANMVLGMSREDIATFDARVTEIIAMQTRSKLLWSDDLIKILKTDLLIREILDGIHAVQPKSVEQSEESLHELLGLDSEDSEDEQDVSMQSGKTTTATEETEEDTSLSDISAVTPVHENSEQNPLSPRDIGLTEWQKYHIENHNLYDLIKMGEINSSTIPDRALTEKEVVMYRFMNRLMQDFLGTSQPHDLNSGATYYEASSLSSTSNPPPSSRSTANSSSTNPEQPKASKVKKAGKDPFIPVISDNTKNIDLQKRNQKQRKLDYLGSGTEMPSWHKEYKERMQRQNPNAELKSDPKVSTKAKPGSKFGKF